MGTIIYSGAATSVLVLLGRDGSPLERRTMERVYEIMQVEDTLVLRQENDGVTLFPGGRWIEVKVHV